MSKISNTITLFNILELVKQIEKARFFFSYDKKVSMKAGEFNDLFGYQIKVLLPCSSWGSLLTIEFHVKIGDISFPISDLNLTAHLPVKLIQERSKEHLIQAIKDIVIVKQRKTADCNALESTID